MASLINLKTGAYRITITRREQQKSIHLGKVNKKAAELVLSMIERIIASNAAGVSLDAETARWTASIDDTLHGKLVKAGVLSERQRRTLGKFIADYIEERSDWKEQTVRTFGTSKNHILNFFGKDTPLEKISADDAVAFRKKLEHDKYSEATIATTVKHSRQIFTIARRRKLITDNPFETVKTGSQRNRKRFYFVTIDEYRQLLEGCTNAKQRLIIALARIGGLRCPIDLCGLRWSEIDWQGKWFWVHSPKTEHHEGKDKRQFPLFPELERRFQELYDTLPEGCDDLIFPAESEIPPGISPKKSLASWIQKVANRAGVNLWQKPFQNMRSSRDTELRKKFPEYLVNQWIGHTQQVAEAHYTQTLPSDFIDAYNAETKVQESAHVPAGIACSGVEAGKTKIIASSCISTAYNAIHNPLQGKDLCKVPPRGNNPTGKHAIWSL
jgi:integrase